MPSPLPCSTQQPGLPSGGPRTLTSPRIPSRTRRLLQPHDTHTTHTNHKHRHIQNIQTTNHTVNRNTHQQRLDKIEPTTLICSASLLTATHHKARRVRESLLPASKCLNTSAHPLAALYSQGCCEEVRKLQVQQLLAALYSQGCCGSYFHNKKACWPVQRNNIHHSLLQRMDMIQS